jgi:BirA family transcriptional regulator, biotin operon repressor / biotin---[acetyl-CoA-carboxylase] ligase
MRTEDSITSASRSKSTRTNQSDEDRLIAAELSATLGQQVIGQRIIVLESTRSTNDFLLQMLTPELPEGFVVFAEHQAAGRGQRGRRWESAPHLGLWFSVLLRPRIARSESARLTNWAAQAIAATIRSETGLQPTIKPPNDVYLGERKVAGVLVETKAGPRDEFAAIAGLGVNINQRPEDFPIELREQAGSLAISLGHSVDRSAFAVALLHELDRSRASM